MELLIFLAAIAALTALAVAANVWGVDSREGSDDPRRSEYPVGLR